MAEVDVVNLEGEKVGKVSLPAKIFEVEPNRDLLFRFIHKQQADKRKGNSSTKTKAEVAGGGRKPWAQKHTGRARSGSNSSPIWRHGGVAFGPKPKDWSEHLNKKMKAGAIKSALSLKFKDKKLIVIDKLEMKEPKTKQFLGYVKKLVPSVDLLCVLDTRSEEQLNVKKSADNIPNAKVIIADNVGRKAVNVDGLNVFDIMKHEWLMLTQHTVEKIVEVYGDDK